MTPDKLPKILGWVAEKLDQTGAYHRWAELQPPSQPPGSFRNYGIYTSQVLAVAEKHIRKLIDEAKDMERV